MHTCFTLCMLCKYSCFLSSADFFLNNSFRNTIRVSKSLDPDQARHFVGPDLGPNFLQILLADNTSRQRVTAGVVLIFFFLVKFEICHFPIGILGQVWNLIVSIPDLCILTYFRRVNCLFVPLQA